MEKKIIKKLCESVVFIVLLFFLTIYLKAAETDMAMSALAPATQPITTLSSEDDGQKVIYLTIDTAMGENYIGEILTVLKEQKAEASFGIMGDWLSLYPEEAMQIKNSAQGVFCHSMEHIRYTDITLDKALKDADLAKTAVEEFFEAECEYIRPPYGAYHTQLVCAMEEQLGMKTLLWSVDAEDWKETASCEEIVEHVLGTVKPGDILLFQSNSPYTAPALERIIPILKQMGYRFMKI